MNPGQTALARIPLVPYSTAAAVVRAITPALAAEYVLVGIGEARRPPIEDQFTIAPPPVGTIALTPCFVPSITPLRSTAMIRSYSSSVTSASPCAPAMPATFSTASTRPNASIAVANMAATCASSVTSAPKATTASPSSSAVSFSRPLTSTARTFAPSRTNTRVVARAIPDPANMREYMRSRRAAKHTPPRPMSPAAHGTGSRVRTHSIRR